MLLTITNTTVPATDLGWLLHKHPEKVQTFTLAFGSATVFYPSHGGALLRGCAPGRGSIGLVRGKPGSEAGGLLDQCVNCRP